MKNLLLLLIISAVQMNCADCNGTLLDEANNLLLNLQRIVADHQASTLQTILPSMDSLRNYSELIRNNSTAEIDSRYQILLGRVQQITECAEANGDDLNYCITNKRAVIRNLPDKVFTLINECLRMRLNEAIEIIEMSVAEIDSTHSILPKMQAKVDECALLPFDEICPLEAITEMLLVDHELTAVTSDIFIKNTEVVYAFQMHLQRCLDMRIPMFFNQGNRIIKIMLDCVNAPHLSNTGPTSVSSTNPVTAETISTTTRIPCSYI